MVNSTQQYMPQDASVGTLKSGHHSRRPFQPRSVNAPSSPSPAKSKNIFIFNHVYRQDRILGPAGCRGTETNFRSQLHAVPPSCHKTSNPVAPQFVSEPTISDQAIIETNKMPVNSRILTCSYNRRRARILPQHHDESTMPVQMTKPQMNPLKSRPENNKKLQVVSENVSQWLAIEKAPTPSLDSEPETSSQPSIFRRRTDVDDQDGQDDDMFVLKRANPVYDSDDEEEYMSSPPKRQRTTEPSVLHWGDDLSDDEDGSFSLPFLSAR